MAALSDDEFIARLQEAFGFRLGRFTRVGARQLYPLSLTRADEHVAERLAVVGNAAQTLHPIAGQGFNLGLRDAASLAEVLADARARARSASSMPAMACCSNAIAMARRRSHNIVRFTDGLVRLFSQPFGPAKLLRRCRHAGVRSDAGGKDALSQLSLGAAGRVPRSLAARTDYERRASTSHSDHRGGGMVGACVAALAAADPELLELRIAVLESQPPSLAG